MYKARIKFYADTPKGEKNKLFCWSVDSILQAEERLLFFLKKNGWNIRAAWFENINLETGEIIENSRFNIADIVERALFPDKQENVKIGDLIDQFALDRINKNSP